ncbi:MAG: T9SS type A sorting domain-containing protein [Deltaproteobacteria bacterium]
MKIFNTLFLIISFLSISAQDETAKITFIEAKPLWEHTLCDSTFIPELGQPGWTKYSSLDPGSIERNGDELYVMAYSDEPHLLDEYGFVLDRLDINTGFKKWSLYNTRFNGSEYDFYHRIGIAANGNLELFGVVNDTSWNIFNISKKIDKQTGKIYKKIISHDTIIKNSYNKIIYHPFILNDSMYLTAYQVGTMTNWPENPMFDFGSNLLLFDSELKLQSKDRFLFDFDSLTLTSVNQGSMIIKLNDRTLLSLAYRDRLKSWDNLGTLMQWIDISDPLDIKIKQVKEFKDIIPGSKEHFRAHRFSAFNNTVCISHYYYNIDIQKYACYILWLDSIGNTKTYIPAPQYQGHLYGLCEMIWANDDFAYLYASPSVTGRAGLDLIRIDHGTDTIKYISSLTLPAGERILNFNIHTLYDDGLFIMGGYAKKTGEELKTSFKIYCFKAQDLGLDFKPSAIKDIEFKISEISIYPNPASDYIILSRENTEAGYIEIVDQLDRLVSQEKAAECEELSIDISALAAGLYFVRMTDDEGRIVGRGKFVKE